MITSRNTLRKVLACDSGQRVPYTESVSDVGNDQRGFVSKNDGTVRENEILATFLPAASNQTLGLISTAFDFRNDFTLVSY